MKRTAVYIEWEDPTSTDDWTDIEDAKKMECYIARTCGLIISEDDAHICVALTVTEPNDSCSNFLVIPTSHIRFRLDLDQIDFITGG